MSQITRIELLSYPDITEEEHKQVKAFLDRVEVISITEKVENHAIEIRRSHRLKLPDALILATATACNCTLVSNDAQLIRADIPGVTVLRTAHDSPPSTENPP